MYEDPATVADRAVTEHRAPRGVDHEDAESTAVPDGVPDNRRAGVRRVAKIEAGLLRTRGPVGPHRHAGGADAGNASYLVVDGGVLGDVDVLAADQADAESREAFAAEATHDDVAERI